MATLTIRALDEAVHRGIQTQAARNGRSMEAEVRQTLSNLYGQPPLGEVLLRKAQQFRDDTGGVCLDLPQRDAPRIPDLSDGRS